MASKQRFLSVIIFAVNKSEATTVPQNPDPRQYSKDVFYNDPTGDRSCNLRDGDANYSPTCSPLGYGGRYIKASYFEAYTASCINAGSPDFVIPIPEVTVTIGGSVSSIPVQHEELIIPIVFEPVQSTQPNFQPNYQPNFQPNYQPNFQPNYQPSYQPTLNAGFQSYMPQTPQVIILDNGNKNDMTWLYMLLLLGNFNKGGNGGSGGNGNCNCGDGWFYDNGYSPRSTF